MRVRQGPLEAVALKIAAVRADWACRHEFLIVLVALDKSRSADIFGGAGARDRVVRIGNQKWRVFAAEKAGGVKRLNGIALSADFKILPDIDKCRDIGIARAQRA